MTSSISKCNNVDSELSHLKKTVCQNCTLLFFSVLLHSIGLHCFARCCSLLFCILLLCIVLHAIVLCRCLSLFVLYSPLSRCNIKQRSLKRNGFSEAWEGHPCHLTSSSFSSAPLQRKGEEEEREHWRCGCLTLKGSDTWKESADNPEANPDEWRWSRLSCSSRRITSLHPFSNTAAAALHPSEAIDTLTHPTNAQREPLSASLTSHA